MERRPRPRGEGHPAGPPTGAAASQAGPPEALGRGSAEGLRWAAEGEGEPAASGSDSAAFAALRPASPAPTRVEAGGGKRTVKGSPFRGAGKPVSGWEIRTAAPRRAPEAANGLQAEPPNSVQAPPPASGRPLDIPGAACRPGIPFSQGRDGCPGCSLACLLVLWCQPGSLPSCWNKEYSSPLPVVWSEAGVLCALLLWGWPTQNAIFRT